MHEITTTQPALPPEVSEEEEILARVHRALEVTRTHYARTDYRAEMERLREALGEARLVEDRASIVEQMGNLAHISKQLQNTQKEDVNSLSPYFGHMRLEQDDGRTRDILIGKQTYVQGTVQIADWRNAPISRVFYQSREGEDFFLRLDDIDLEGEVMARRTVSIQEGELRRVSTSDTTYVMTEDGAWAETGGTGPALKGGAGKALRPKRSIRKDKHLPEIAALLDKEQFDLITRPDAGLVVIQGSAGSGKTTVALHRVAYLAFQSPRKYCSGNTLVVVYSRALARYISQVLPSLGVEGVQVMTLDVWARRVRKKAFPGLPDRHSHKTPAVVSRLKLHAGILPMLEDALEENQGRTLTDIFNECFTSKSWLKKKIAAYAPNSFSEHEIHEIHHWCSRLHAIRDGGGDGDEKPCLDEEDDILLLRLYQMKHGRLPGKKKKSALSYAHLVVDEAQDFSPVELAVLLGSVRKKHPITLAGDTAQKIVEGNDFQDWSYVLQTLGLSHVQVSPLKISYRSTAQIMEVARAVLGPLAPDEKLETTREGMPVELFRFSNEGVSWAFLADRLRDLLYQEPSANVALLTRYSHQARRAYEALERAELPRLRLVSDQEFSFQPGIEIAEIHQTKGLEFDYVVVLDADAETFPVNDSSRHQLHVAITRAAYLCWLVSVKPPSRLLPEWLEETREA